MVEIEIRGVLNKQDALKLEKFLKLEAKFEKSFKRLSVELQPGEGQVVSAYDPKSMVLRVKKSDAEEKISLKVGDWTGVKAEEFEVVFETGGIIMMIKLLEKFGFSQGMILFWESWVYEYQGCEVKLSKYTDDYYMWEIEAREENEELAKTQVYDLAKELNLDAIKPEDFERITQWQNENIFEKYSIDRAIHRLEEAFGNS